MIELYIRLYSSIFSEKSKYRVSQNEQCNPYEYEQRLRVVQYVRLIVDGHTSWIIIDYRLNGFMYRENKTRLVINIRNGMDVCIFEQK
jgi:hypothetical protein